VIPLFGQLSDVLIMAHIRDSSQVRIYSIISLF